MTFKIRWFKRIKPRERIFLIAVLTFLFTYLAASLLVLPAIQQYRLDGDLIEGKREMLEGYRKTLEMEHGLKLKMSALEAKAKSFDRYMVKSEKPGIAAAQLQNRVKETADRYGLDIISEKIAKPQPGVGYVAIPVEVTARGTLEPLKNFLYDIETGPSFMTISEITVRSNKRRTFDAATRKYKDTEDLQATILITEIMKGTL